MLFLKDIERFMNSISRNDFYIQMIAIFFILSFIDLTIKLNIYIFIPLFLFFILIFSSFNYKLSYVLPFSIFGLIYFIIYGFGELYRFEKTFLIAIPITYLLFKYSPYMPKVLRYFLNLNVLVIYVEFFTYNVFGLLLMPNTDVMLGLPRYHAFFSDSNFYSYSIVCYMIYNKIKSDKFNLWYIGSIFISLSISAITVMVLFLMFFGIYKKYISKVKNTRILFLFFITFGMSFYYYTVLNSDDIRKLSEDEAIKFKLVSMSIRFEVQSQAIHSIIENNSILFGMGTGTAKEMNDYGLNLHNTYLQAFLEIGLIGLLTIIGFFLIIFFNTNVLFLPLLSVIFLLGNILEVFYFPLLLFIFYLSKVYEGGK